MHKGLLFLIVPLLMLTACAQREGLAPVTESRWQETATNKKKHTVQPGETLYAIAFRYDKDYRHLAQINHLQSPYTLKIGQSIRIQSNASASRAVVAKSVKKKPQQPHRTVKKQQPRYPTFSGQWQWPVKGKIVNQYSPRHGKKGIDISGNKREKIHAASNGIVAYSGNGLSSYGNLIIIKHDNQYLTAYGNNARNFVKEGQRVKAGQVIAQMGLVDRRFWGLHFEIRKAGKPVNPLNYLKKG